MTDTPEHPDPWADVLLPAPFDAREIYEYATSVGAERRGQRRRRQLVLTVCGCLVVALTAAGIGLSGGDGGGETSIQLASQGSIPRAPVRTKETVPASKPHPRASAPRKSAAPPAPPITSQCHAFARVTSFSANLTALHLLPVLDTTTTPPTTETTTTTTTMPPPPDTTTTTTSPRPPRTTPTTRRTTPPTRITVSPDTAFIPPALGGAPISPSPFPRRRTRC